MSVGEPGRGRPTGDEVVDERRRHRHLLLRVDDPLTDALDDHAAEVHRVVELAAGEDETIEQGHGDAARGAVGDGAEQRVGRGPVEVDRLVDAGEGHRQHHRTGRCDGTDVRDGCLVEDGVHDISVVGASLGMAPQPGPVGGLVGAHDADVRGPEPYGATGIRRPGPGVPAG